MATVAWKFCLSLSNWVASRRNCLSERRFIRCGCVGGRGWVEDGVGVVALVGEHRLRAAIAEQPDGLGAVVAWQPVSTKPSGRPSASRTTLESHHGCRGPLRDPRALSQTPLAAQFVKRLRVVLYLP
jgi:hypothetical protein